MRPGSIVVRPQQRPNGQKVSFKPNEYIVYPAHGVGQIVAVEEQEVAGFKLELFVISFIKDKMILKVPVPKVASVGMRKLADAGIVEKALTTLTGRARIKRTMWSRLGISKERVRQIESRAIEKLRRALEVRRPLPV